MDWLAEHWTDLLPWALIVADKIVTVTPVKWDDLILTAIRGGLTAVGLGKKK